MNFASDNVYGVDPRIMQAMVAANGRLTDVSYCHDDGAKDVDARLSKIFGREVKAFLVMNGTGANSLALSTLAPPHGAIFCHETSHINTDECNCPELFTGGAKLITLPGDGGKIAPESVAAKLGYFGHGEHGPKPTALSVSNVTELGRVYSPAEVAALSAVVRPKVSVFTRGIGSATSPVTASLSSARRLFALSRVSSRRVNSVSSSRIC